MPKAPQSSAKAPPPASGIFCPQHWHRWRGATLRIELDGEPPFTARLDEVALVGELASGSRRQAHLTELDTAGKPVGVRTLPWPPSGSIRVLRAP